MKALIIDDDEEESRNLLEKSIAMYCKDISLGGMACSGEEAYSVKIGYNLIAIYSATTS